MMIFVGGFSSGEMVVQVSMVESKGKGKMKRSLWSSCGIIENRIIFS